MLTDKQREILDELYYNPKTGYTELIRLNGKPNYQQTQLKITY